MFYIAFALMFYIAFALPMKSLRSLYEQQRHNELFCVC